MQKAIDTRIRELKQSPIFALTKGNNELSHTNFWAWLIEEITDESGNHPFIKLFIPDFYVGNKYDYHHVGREDGHRDLTIYYREKGADSILCHVVENKLKSIPTKKQLKGYEDIKVVIDGQTNTKKNAVFAKGTLTGIECTLELDDDLSLWKLLTYDELAERMDSIAKDIKALDDNTAMIIRDYICDIRNISNVIKTELESTNETYTWDAGKLEEVKLGDLFLKLKGCKLRDYINDRIDEYSSKLKDNEWGLPKAECSFNNKKPTITVVYKQEVQETGKSGKVERKEVGRIGIQIEGDQFRIYGGPSIEQSWLKDHKKLYDFLSEKGWFYDDIKPAKKKDGKTISGIINGNDTKMKGGHGCKGKYCKYETKEYTHVYQYWDLKSDNFKSIADEVIEKLEAARAILKELDFSKESIK